MLQEIYTDGGCASVIFLKLQQQIHWNKLVQM